MRLSTIVGIFILLLSSCNSISLSDHPEGVIEYDVLYLSNKSGIPTNLLPKKATLKFKNHKGVTSIDGFMGLFSLKNICDFRKCTNTMILKVMDNKYYYPGAKYDPPFFFDSLNNIKITLNNEIKNIAGLTCKKATVTFNSSNQNPFEVYYTEQIKIKNPNKSNQFSPIKGVLMQFNIRLSNIDMHFTASKYKPEKISDDVFKVPDNYRKISKEKLSGVLAKLLE